MKLNEILKKYSVFKIAEQSDSKRLNTFFLKSIMDADGLQLTYQRQPDFFTFLKFHGDHNIVFYAENEKKEIILVASISLRDGYINRKIERIAYLSDMRIDMKYKPGRLIVKWKQCMGDIIINSAGIEEIKTKYMITAIMQDNTKAIKSLVNNSRNPFLYKKISNYSMINILASITKYKGNLSVERATFENKNFVFEFIDSIQSKREFGFSKSYLERALLVWNNLNIEDFIIVKRDGLIIGACCLWNPSPTKKIIISQMPFSLKILKIMSTMFLSIPGNNEEFKVQYLNFLSILNDEEEVLDAVISFAKSEKIFKHFHSLSFSSFDIDEIVISKRKYILNRTPLSLFQVVGANNREDLLEYVLAPGFEISLV